MHANMEREEYIRKYFEGTLSAEETLAFEELLKEDHTFAAEFEFEKNVKKAIILNKRKALKETFQAYEKPGKSYKWLFAAASIVAIVGLFTWNSFFNTNFDSLYNEYYQTYPNTIAPTVRGEGVTDLRTKAFLAYDAGKFKTSLELFTKLYETSSEDYALFYKGVSLMELEKYREALEVFKNNNLYINPTYMPFSKWYAALANLKLENKAAAISILEELAKTENPQKQAALKLLADLE